MLHINYLSEDHIRGFDNYKYSSVDTSPVAVYISHPFWNTVVKFYPRWLAPNVLTLSGMLLVMFYSGVVSYFDYYMLASSDTRPDFAPVPNWVWCMCSILTFAAHVLDGTDGKQARRTGMCGPTGELFDHGIDSWLTLPFTITLFSVFGREDYSVSSMHLLYVLASVQLVFVVSHWEKYNTGVLFLSWGYDVSQYFLSLFYMVTFLGGGYGMCKFYVIPWLQISPAQIAELSFYVSCFCMSIPMSLYNLRQSYLRGEQLQSGCWEAMLPLVSTFVLFATSFVWTFVSPNDIINTDPRAFLWLMGTIFSNIACRLIISQMTSTRCEILNFMLLPYLVCVFVSVAFGEVEVILVRIMAILITIAHVHYGVCVVNQMCSHFKMSPLRVRDVSETLLHGKVEYSLLQSESATESL